MRLRTSIKVCGWAVVLAIAAATASAQNNSNIQSASANNSTPATTSKKSGESLWIAKFKCEPKAAHAVALTQRADLDALQYSTLFSRVVQFSAMHTAPADAWTLTGKELDFSGGSTAARSLIGWGAGRAHLVMLYQLRNRSGKVVWSKKIKTAPSFWGTVGHARAVQNQSPAWNKQGQALVDALQKYFRNNPQYARTS